MGIIKRIKDVISANANAAIEKMEKPEKMLDYYIKDAELTLGEIKVKTADAMVVQEKCRKKVIECENQVRELNAYAEEAFRKGSDEDGVQFLQKRIYVEQQLETYRKSLAEADENVEKMKEMYDSMNAKLQECKDKRAVLYSRLAVAETSAQISAFASVSGKADTSIANFYRMEEKVDNMLLKQNAIGQLNREESTMDRLKQKYDIKSSDQELSEEVKKFKAGLGMVV
jgi:phage shock protein A